MYLITGNKNKLAEAEQILGQKVQNKDIDLVEIQELDIYKIVKHKVLEASKHVDGKLFVWDISLEIDGLNSFPGPLVKWFFQKITFDQFAKIAKSFESKKAVAICVLGYFDGVEAHYFEGKIEGSIASEPRGKYGWGWDQIFIPTGESRTYAEIPRQEVLNLRSHKIALEKFQTHLVNHN